MSILVFPDRFQGLWFRVLVSRLISKTMSLFTVVWLSHAFLGVSSSPVRFHITARACGARRAGYLCEFQGKKEKKKTYLGVLFGLETFKNTTPLRRILRKKSEQCISVASREREREREQALWTQPGT